MNVYCYGIAEENVKEIASKLNNSAAARGIYHCTNFKSISKIMEIENPDILIIEPEFCLNDMSGIVFGERIRNDFPFCEIIFISANYIHLPEIVCRGIKPTAYFLKPLNDVRFYDIVINIMKNRKTQSDKKITLTSEYKKEEVYLNDILYFTTENKKIICVTSEGRRIDFYDTMSALEKRFSEDFLRCHSGFLINIGKIASYPKNLTYILLNGEKENIPVSRKYKTEVFEKLTNYIKN